MIRSFSKLLFVILACQCGESRSAILSRNKAVKASNDYYDWVPARMVDGDLRTNPGVCFCCSITPNELNPWYELDLGKSHRINQIDVIGRSDWEPIGRSFTELSHHGSSILALTPMYISSLCEKANHSTNIAIKASFYSKAVKISPTSSEVSQLHTSSIKELSLCNITGNKQGPGIMVMSPQNLTASTICNVYRVVHGVKPPHVTHQGTNRDVCFFTL